MPPHMASFLCSPAAPVSPMAMVSVNRRLPGFPLVALAPPPPPSAPPCGALSRSPPARHRHAPAAMRNLRFLVSWAGLGRELSAEAQEQITHAFPPLTPPRPPLVLLPGCAPRRRWRPPATKRRRAAAVDPNARKDDRGIPATARHLLIPLPIHLNNNKSIMKETLAKPPIRQGKGRRRRRRANPTRQEQEKIQEEQISSQKKRKKNKKKNESKKGRRREEPIDRASDRYSPGGVGEDEPPLDSSSSSPSSAPLPAKKLWLSPLPPAAGGLVRWPLCWAGRNADSNI